VPEVVLCIGVFTPFQLQIHFTVSPRLIRTDAGSKQMQLLGLTVTLTVAAPAIVRQKAKNEATINTVTGE
jgi:hypothetical protein